MHATGEKRPKRRKADKSKLHGTIGRRAIVAHRLPENGPSLAEAGESSDATPAGEPGSCDARLENSVQTEQDVIDQEVPVQGPIAAQNPPSIFDDYSRTPPDSPPKGPIQKTPAYKQPSRRLETESDDQLGALEALEEDADEVRMSHRGQKSTLGDGELLHSAMDRPILERILARARAARFGALVSELLQSPATSVPEQGSSVRSGESKVSTRQVQLLTALKAAAEFRQPAKLSEMHDNLRCAIYLNDASQWESPPLGLFDAIDHVGALELWRELLVRAAALADEMARLQTKNIVMSESHGQGLYALLRVLSARGANVDEYTVTLLASDEETHRWHCEFVPTAVECVRGSVLDYAKHTTAVDRSVLYCDVRFGMGAAKDAKSAEEKHAHWIRWLEELVGKRGRSVFVSADYRGDCGTGGPYGPSGALSGKQMRLTAAGNFQKLRAGRLDFFHVNWRTGGRLSKGAAVQWLLRPSDHVFAETRFSVRSDWVGAPIPRPDGQPDATSSRFTVKLYASREPRASSHSAAGGYGSRPSSPGRTATPRARPTSPSRPLSVLSGSPAPSVTSLRWAAPQSPAHAKGVDYLHSPFSPHQRSTTTSPRKVFASPPSEKAAAVTGLQDRLSLL